MAELNELQRLAEPGTSMLVAAETMQKLIAVARAAELAKAALEMGEPDDAWSIEWRALAALRTALEGLK